MKKYNLRTSILFVLGGLALVSGQASAHVGYGSALYSGAGVYDPLTNNTGAGAGGPGASFTATVSSNAGYLEGLDPQTLGNTHDNRFRYFTLDATSTVSFTIQGTVNANGSSTLNPGFSLYNGVLPASSHEGVGDIANVAADTDTAAYLATAPQFASWSPFSGVNGLRGGAAAGSPSNPTGLWGVFDTNGSITTGNNGAWTAANNSATDTHGPNYLGNLDTPKIATITYTGISGADALVGATFTDSTGGTQSVLGADGTLDNRVSWTGTLGPGVYTLAIGGVDLLNYANIFADVRSSNGGLGTDAAANAAYTADRLARGLTFSSFTVNGVEYAPVPVPAAVWLFGSALGGLGIFGRRKAKNNA